MLLIRSALYLPRFLLSSSGARLHRSRPGQPNRICRIQAGPTPRVLPVTAIQGRCDVLSGPGSFQWGRERFTITAYTGQGGEGIK